MALFKVCRGNETNLPSTKNDGYAYFCTDTGNFFIDWASTNETVTRVQINSNCAYKLRYQDGGEYVEIDALSVNSHINNNSNPHSVTKLQVGLGDVDNTSDINKPVSIAQATAIADAKKAGTDAQSGLSSHTGNISNPHKVTAAQVGADPEGTASSAVSGHNTNTSAHNDIRDLISSLTTRLNALANSDDTTLDQMAEIVAYIKNNKSLIDGVTTSKVNVADIVNNLTSNVSSKPLSAAQGVALKAMIDAVEEVTVDSALSTTSANPIQNKVVKAAIDQLSANISNKSDGDHTHDYPVDSVNNKTGAVTLSASDVGAVPTSRTVNGKSLSGNITLSASDVGARPSDWMPSASQVGAQPALGFTPVQQGLDDGRGNNKIRIAWGVSGGTKGGLDCYVDGTYVGKVVVDNSSFGGICPPENGGTGVTSLTSLRTNLFPTHQTTPTYIPTFGSGWNGAGYCTVAQMKEAIGIGSMTDFVVAQGTSGSWTYIKWNSGIAEVWGHLGEGVYYASGSWNGLYYTPIIGSSVNYPFPFTSFPDVMASPYTYSQGSDFWLCASSGNPGSTSSPPLYCALTTTSGATIATGVSYYIVGRWK